MEKLIYFLISTFFPLLINIIKKPNKVEKIDSKFEPSQIRKLGTRYKRRRVDESDTEKDNKEILGNELISLQEQSPLLRMDEKEKVEKDSQKKDEVEGDTKTKNSQKYCYY
jgi:hypothetical protein